MKNMPLYWPKNKYFMNTTMDSSWTTCVICTVQKTGLGLNSSTGQLRESDVIIVKYSLALNVDGPQKKWGSIWAVIDCSIFTAARLTKKE